MKNFSFLLLVLFLFSCSNSKIVVSKDIASTQNVLNIEIPQDSTQISNRLLLEPPLIIGPVKIIATGDLMLGTIIDSNSFIPDNVGTYFFEADVQKILKNGDITFGNLEGAICGNTGIPKNKEYVFAMADNSAEILSNVGYNLLSTANNHALDMGIEGKRATEFSLMKSNIYYAGYADVPTTQFEINNISYGFLAVSPNYGVVNIHNIKLIREQIIELNNNCDIVIVSMHIGAEGKEHQHITRKQEYFMGEDRGNPFRFAREMIDSGADIILGHGPHVTRAIEIYKDRFIAYSLGNFCTINNIKIQGVNGIAPIVELVIDIDGRFISGKIHPTKQLYKSGVVLDDDNSVIKLMQQLILKDFPESKITITDDGMIYKSSSR